MPSYEKSKSSGLWSCRFRETSLEDGTIKQKRLSGFKTKKEAQYGYEDYIAEHNRILEEKRQKKTVEESPTDILFETLVELFFQYEKARIKESSYYDLTMKIKSKILPFFKGMYLGEITPAKILEWQASLNEYSYKYRKNLHAHLASIYNYAEKYYDIKNIMKKVDRPRNLEAKKEMLFWTPEEFSKFIEKVDRPQYKALFRFLYITGCRRGEALAMTWSDIDLDAGKVKINKNIAYKVGANNKPYQITTPKNMGSNRTVVIPNFFCKQLKEYRDWQKENCPSTDFVFGSADPLPPTSIERIMTSATKEANIKRIRIHDLRHSCASLLIHKGVSIVAVSRHLGHSTVEQTLNTYSHMMPDDQTMILNSLNSLSDM